MLTTLLDVSYNYMGTLAQDEEPENKGYLTTARITGTWKDRAENMARGIICDVLTGTNESVLKRAALERELARDTSGIEADIRRKKAAAVPRYSSDDPVTLRKYRTISGPPIPKSASQTAEIAI